MRKWCGCDVDDDNKDVCGKLTTFHYYYIFSNTNVLYYSHSHIYIWIYSVICDTIKYIDMNIYVWHTDECGLNKHNWRANEQTNEQTNHANSFLRAYKHMQYAWFRGFGHTWHSIISVELWHPKTFRNLSDGRRRRRRRRRHRRCRSGDEVAFCTKSWHEQTVEFITVLDWRQQRRRRCAKA